MYQRQGSAAYKPNLNNTLALVEYLGNPENAFKSIHVAGTNGKGSTSHMLASILQEAGYKTGLYTSPHLKDFRERIKINGKMISESQVVSFVNAHKDFFSSKQLSFFEMTVGLAFDCFRSENVDIAIVEVGLGGRLDSTNIITPELSVITNIGLDHTQFLGNTLAEIAKEKAGIIKEGVSVVIGETQTETIPVFREISATRNAPLYRANVITTPLYTSDLKGHYQVLNQRTVLKSIDVLQQQGWIISKEHIEKGLANVIANTGLKGRWQVLQEHPKVICDTAHNREGLNFVIAQLEEEKFDALHIVLGVVSDKDVMSILPLFPKEARYYFCAPDIARAMPVAVLKKHAATFSLKGKAHKSVALALKTAVDQAAATDLIFVGGSTFVVAEVV